MNPAIETTAFVGFIAFGSLLFVGQTTALVGFIPCFAILSAACLRDIRMEKNKALWIIQRALLAGVVLAARRAKNGHWF